MGVVLLLTKNHRRHCGRYSELMTVKYLFLQIKQIQEYLNKKFFSEYYEVKEDNNNSNSAEVYFKNEFIGLIYKDDEDGELAYQFHMTILDEDLLNS